MQIKIPIGINIGGRKLVEPYADVLHLPEYSTLNENNYSQIFNSTLIGDGICTDSVGNILVAYLDQIDCESNNGEWTLSGTCYNQDENGDIVDDDGDGENDSEPFTNQISCEGNGKKWVSFFNINVLKTNWEGAKTKDNIIVGTNFEAFFTILEVKINEF